MDSPRWISCYEKWAPLVARILFAALFLMGAAFKIPMTQGFAMEAGMTAAAGVPFAPIAVTLAFFFEVGLSVALIFGWHTRAAAFVLAVMTLAFAIIFHSNFADPTAAPQFIMHMGLIAGLLYVSVYGAKNFALRKD